jgi:hypothetical protein
MTNDVEPVTRGSHHLHVKVPGDLWARFKRFFPAKGDVPYALTIMIRTTVERLEREHALRDTFDNGGE